MSLYAGEGDKQHTPKDQNFWWVFALSQWACYYNLDRSLIHKAFCIKKAQAGKS